MNHKNPGISEPQIAAMFNRIAPRYDFLNRLLSAKQDQRWRKLMIAELPYQPDGLLVDMATGTGDVALQAAREHIEYRTIQGVDISEGMLKLAEKKARTMGLADRVAWQVGSAEHIHVDSSSADAVTISFGLRNVVDKQRAILEFSRILKPGGKLLILEFFTPESTTLARLFQFYFHHVLPKIGSLFSDKSAYEYLPKSVASFYSSSELTQVLADAGLSVYKSKSFLFGSCRLVGAVKK
jgi:demethylmenaquinone methyltransferase/2-methoxy-6-polyprenyl-1,4-benzoquinol methylase